MKNKITLLIAVFLLTGIFSVSVAQEDFKEEAILNFHANIVVNTDNSINVEETILYETGAQDRHGIYRDIYPYSATGKKMNIRDISVVDEDNNPHMFEASTVGKNIRIKIGDPDQTFTGEKSYIVKYNATRAVSQLEDLDEIYWNVTGSEWLMPIHNVSAVVVVPKGATPNTSACYYGFGRSTSQCESSATEDGVFIFSSPVSLNIGEEFTVAVGFPKGFVEAYGKGDIFSDLFYKYSVWVFAGILPLVTLFFCLRHWHKKGRDPKGRGVIVPQYDVPEGLTPMEVGGIVNEKVKTGDISSEIILFVISHSVAS